MYRAFATLTLALAYMHVNAQPVQIIIDAQASVKAAASSEQSRLQSSDASIEWIVPVKVDATALKRGTVAANLFDQKVMITLPSEPVAADTRTPIWIGYAVDANSPADQAVDLTSTQLYRTRDGALAGYISIGDAIYQLRLMDGRQVLVKRNARILLGTPDEPLFKDRVPLPPKKANTQPSSLNMKADDAHNTIRIVLAFTNSAANAAGGIEALRAELTTAVNNANVGYANSDIELSLEIAAMALPTYSETSIQTSLDDLYQGNGGLWLPHYARNDQYADVVALVVNTSATEPAMCGQAASLGAMDPSYAMVVVQYSCLPAHSLAHEISHLMWADHDPDNQIATPPLVEYGHGYRKDQATGSPGWSTVMAYSNCAVKCPRINRFSSPDLQYNGLPLGTAAVHNNAQLIRETNFWIAEMYSDPPPPTAEDTSGSKKSGGVVKFYTPSSVTDIEL